MKKKESKQNFWLCCGNNSFWGWFLVLIGAYYLLTAIGIIPQSIPFWPIILIALGVYFLIKKRNNRC